MLFCASSAICQYDYLSDSLAGSSRYGYLVLPRISPIFEKQVEIVASDELRDRLIAHARALHQVVRDGLTFPDWWAHCSGLQAELLAQLKQDLTPAET
jgi:hypothetical protein